MAARTVRRLLLCLALAGCGGGSVTLFLADDGSFAVFGGNTRVTVATTIELNGSAFLPRGASCAFTSSPFAPRACVCDAGPQAVGQWSNSTIGTAGPLELTILANASCMPVETAWRAAAVALVPGSNFVTLELFDDSTQGSAMVTVVRN